MKLRNYKATNHDHAYRLGMHLRPSRRMSVLAAACRCTLLRCSSHNELAS